MSMHEYGMYEVMVSDEKIKEVAPDEWGRLLNLFDEYDAGVITLADIDLGNDSLLESWQEKALVSAYVELQDKVRERTGVSVYAVSIPGGAAGDMAGEDFFAAELRFSDEIEELLPEMVVWVEIG